MEIPDALSQLKDFLRVFGLNERDSSAVAKYMESFDLNDLNRLNAALRDVAMPLPRRRLLIESWANVRNIQVPLNLQKELNIQPMPSFGPSMPSPYGSSYGFMEQPQKREDLDLFDRLIKWESLKMQSQQQTIAQPNLENQYQQQIETLRLELQKAQENYRAEVEKLKEELRRKEQERLEERLRSLEERLRSYERPSGDYRDDEMRLFAEAIKEIGRKNPMQQVLDFLSKHPELIAMAQGQIPTERIAPPQTRQGLIQILRERGLVVPS
jgi:hypothetical protein